MNNTNIKDTFFAKKGQFANVTFKSQLKVSAKYKGTLVEKIVQNLIARVGVEYDNMKSVIEKREDGTLPVENQGLTWGQWDQYPYTIKHNNATYYRFSVAKNINNNHPLVTYLINGIESTIDQVKELCIPSQFTPREHSLDVFTVKEDNIIAIK